MSQAASLSAFRASLEAWIAVNMDEFSRILDEHPELDARRYALCSRWLKLIETAFHPGAATTIERLAQHAMNNIDHWMDEPQPDAAMIGHIGQLMLGWPRLIVAALAEPQDDAHLDALLRFLAADCWPQPLNDDALVAFVEAFERDCLPAGNDAATDAGTPEAGEQDTALLHAFRDEVLHACADIGSASELMAMPDAHFSILFNIRDAWVDLMATTLQMCDTFELRTLESCCHHFMQRLEALEASSDAGNLLWAERMDAWLMLFVEAVSAIEEAASSGGEELLAFVQDEEIWQEPEDAQTPTASEQHTADIPPPEPASPADMVLTPDADVHAEVLHEFLFEAEEHAAAFSRAMHRLQQGQNDPQTLATAQRIAHTLKGASNTTGYLGIAHLTHHAEDLLEYLYQHHLAPPSALLALLIDVADCLEMIVEHIQGRAAAPENALELLNQLKQWAYVMQQGRLDEGATALPAMPPLAAPEQAAAPSPPPADGEEHHEAAQVDMLRIPTTAVDHLMRHIGELSIVLGEMRNRFDHLVKMTEQRGEQELNLYHHGVEMDALLTARGMALVRGNPASHERAGGDEQDFDPLEMDQYNELHSGLSRLMESISDTRSMSEAVQGGLDAMDALLLNHKRLFTDLHGQILQTRMMPFSNIESRLQRIVRQTARKTGKEANLYCNGMELMIDADLLHKIADPLMHILRNAVDHGLESPDVRQQKGKAAEGRVDIGIAHIGTDIRIRCSDDGKGLDFDRIRRTAESKGLIQTDAALSDDELARLTLLPGFSTRSEATQISGRGFGMDIVFQQVSQLKGRLRLTTGERGGLMVEIHLPVTLTTVHSLLVSSHHQRYAIPSRDVLRVLNSGEGSLQSMGQHTGLAFEGHLYPVHDLNALLWGEQTPLNEQLLAQRLPLIVRTDEKKQVVLVDRVDGCHELILKGMGRHVPHIRGISGATILSDSHVVTVLDLAELLRHGDGQAMRSAQTRADAKVYAKSKARETTVMIVDDSLSVRRTLSSLMQDMGYKTLLAIDGIEAISMLEHEVPDIMLLDLELPRMNGLELCSYMRKQATTAAVPVIMITSRATQKHRDRAAQAGVNHYLVKPYQEDVLLHQIETLLGTAAAS